jgi:hypothetical protein
MHNWQFLQAELSSYLAWAISTRGCAIEAVVNLGGVKARGFERDR